MPFRQSQNAFSGSKNHLGLYIKTIIKTQKHHCGLSPKTTVTGKNKPLPYPKNTA